MQFLGMALAFAVGAGFLSAPWLIACAVIAYVHGVMVVSRIPGREDFRDLTPDEFRIANRQVQAVQLASAAMMAVAAGVGWILAWMFSAL